MVVRDRLRNGHDVIVVGCDGETQASRDGGARSAFGRMVRVVGAAGCGLRAGRTAAATRVRRVRLRPASTGAASEVAVRTAGGGEVDAVAAVPPLREQAAAYAAWFVPRMRSGGTAGTARRGEAVGGSGGVAD